MSDYDFDIVTKNYNFGDFVNVAKMLKSGKTKEDLPEYFQEEKIFNFIKSLSEKLS